MLYNDRLISKVLTTRLQIFVDILIDFDQAALVSARETIDYILFSDALVKGYGRKVISPRCMLKIDMQKTYDSYKE